MKLESREVFKYPEGIKPMNHQTQAMRKAWRKEEFALFMEMGCIDGDAVVSTNKSKKTIKMKLSEFHRRFHNPSPTAKSENRWHVRCLKDGVFGNHPVQNVLYKGNKESLTVILASGKTIKCTPDHEILTSYGWVEAKDLTDGHFVMTNGEEGFIDKDGYRRIYRPDHPRANPAGAVYEHIVVAEEKYGRAIGTDMHVHHEDHNKSNNSPDNLVLLTAEEHLLLHGADYRKNMDGGIHPYSGGRIVVVPKEDRVVSVEEAGMIDVYDIVMDDPYRNFVANGIVVHNCGKTFTTIALAGHRYNHYQINAVLVIVPTPIKPVWEWEVDKMSPVPSVVHVHESGGNKATEAFIHKDYPLALKYLVIGVEALSQGKAHEFALAYVKRHDCLVVVDESSRIKNADAARTKKTIRCGDSADYRMILTGTPITQGLIDLFGQFRFLGEHIIGLKSFFVFRNMYCIMGGFQGKKVLGYQREEELMDRLAPYVYQVKKEECLDLPDKVYRKLEVLPTKEQVLAMKELKDFFETEQNGDILTVSTVLDRMTRFQQILGGNFPFATEEGTFDVKPIEGKNPKMDAMLEDIEDLPKDAKVIIWARFRPEIDQISKRLRELYGEGSVIEYHGGVSESERKASIPRFQDKSHESRFFVANQQTAGMGITITVATYAYYYSNSFSLEQRLQSEDRNHRKGQTNKCTYIDIWCKADADLMIGKALKSKKDLATLVDEELQKRIEGTR